MTEKINKYFRLGNPIKPGELEQAYKDGLIPKSDLKVEHFYYGHCRNARLAMWTGTHFVYLRYKFGSTFLEDINCPEDDDGYDIFTASQEVAEDDPDLDKLKEALAAARKLCAALDSTK